MFSQLQDEKKNQNPITLDVPSASSQILLGGNQEMKGMKLDPDWMDADDRRGQLSRKGGGTTENSLVETPG